MSERLLLRGNAVDGTNAFAPARVGRLTGQGWGDDSHYFVPSPHFVSWLACFLESFLGKPQGRGNPTLMHSHGVL